MRHAEARFLVSRNFRLSPAADGPSSMLLRARACVTLPQLHRNAPATATKIDAA